MRTAVIRTILLLLCTFVPTLVKATPEVLATIKPVHALAARLMVGLPKEPYLLLPDSASPHSYQLRPSDANALHNADVIFWIGPRMESFLVQPLENLARKPAVLAISDLPKLNRLEKRDQNEWYPPSIIKPSGVVDAHLWLDPHNAQLALLSMRDMLVAADPEHAELYQRNAEEAVKELIALEGEIQEQLAPHHDKSYMVFHDAYQYFEHRFHLKSVGSFHIRPDVPPTVKQINHFLDTVEAHQVVCVFTEPQFSSSLLPSLLEDHHQTQLATLDPIGYGIKPGPNAYNALLRKLSNDLDRCLSGQLQREGQPEQ